MNDKWILFFVICFIWTMKYSSAVNEEGCKNIGALPSWNFSKSSPPANVRQTSIISTKKNDAENDGIRLTLTANKTAAFCLWLFVLPYFKKDNQTEEPSCSPVLVRSLEIRKFFKVYSSIGLIEVKGGTAGSALVFLRDVVSLDCAAHTDLLSDEHHGAGSTNSVDSGPLSPNDNDTKSGIIEYYPILTGCFYIVLSELDGTETWQLEPKFYSTAYPYYDDNVRLDSSSGAIDEWLKPEDSTNDRKLYVGLKTSLDCMGVAAWLYETEPHSDPNNVINRIKRGNVSDKAAQQCLVSTIPGKITDNVPCNEETNITLKVKCYIDSTDIALNVTLLQKDEGSNGWAAILKWKKLSRERKKYIFYYRGIFSNCACLTIKRINIRSRWTYIENSDEHNCEYVGESDVTVNRFVKNNCIMMTIIVSSIGMALGVIFLVVKWFRLLMAINLRKKYANIDILSSYSLLNSDHDQILSDRIMLLYAKGSGPFMAAMNDFRRKLKEACDCEVHDIFDDEEFDRIAVNGPSGWVDELLRAGSKLVWVDTPQFRSKLKKPENIEQTADDFREVAIFNAVAEAPALFLNSVTQYLRHFVVRIEGFEVEEEKDDPLLVVSPHTRYRIPQHFHQLCGDLTGPPIVQMNVRDERKEQ